MPAAVDKASPLEACFSSRLCALVFLKHCLSSHCALSTFELRVAPPPILACLPLFESSDLSLISPKGREHLSPKRACRLLAF